MDTRTLLRHFFGKGKLSTREISLKMGRSHSYLSRYLYRESVPSSDNLAEIMDAINHDLLVRNRSTGEEIIIDPPEKPEG